MFEDKKEPKGYKYRCQVNCVYMGKFRREGDVITLPEKKEVPHFKFVDEEKN